MTTQGHHVYCLGQRRAMSNNQVECGFIGLTFVVNPSAQPYHSPSSYLGSPFVSSTSYSFSHMYTYVFIMSAKIRSYYKL